MITMKPINRFSNSFMIYSPKGTLKGSMSNCHGISMLSYLVDLSTMTSHLEVGTKPPFKPVQAPYVVDFLERYFIMDDQYILVSDGERILGMYKEGHGQKQFKRSKSPEMNP